LASVLARCNSCSRNIANSLIFPVLWRRCRSYFARSSLTCFINRTSIRGLRSKQQ
jgi:hypothetical protein